MSDQSGEHVHWVGDGRGQRQVIIDGQAVTGAIYCDTQAGVAVLYDQPLKSSDGEHADFHPVWGDVRVIYCGGHIQGSRTFRMGEGPIV